mmetsp:Transcript_6845/g.12080  ORF Transcript_6845/g.12080 Transcript_6845/m.12080 type:complete len:136 (-) Transcript_6845:221-628(-)|eukprot:CAMPEP_0184516386 /NCGR_PEP_ID=MMETSP0198_2-20121128/5003_1 /TAXON_ID=1112570 /ORGANISM="Thraustochytrium sp., Strain LLF1b" /LENGTH=135 /DNA_ID=CAMNT_0026906707 /DNA_START=31 /DNA_END=438 /DNA_ORIENTATION=+
MASSDGKLTSVPGGKVNDLMKAARDYEPLIPSAVVDYHLKKSGCIMSDPDLVRVVALAAQKLCCDIVTATRVQAYGRQRVSSRQRSEKRPATAMDKDGEKKPKLTTKDLESSLLKAGIVSDVPPYLTSTDFDSTR